MISNFPICKPLSIVKLVVVVSDTGKFLCVDIYAWQMFHVEQLTNESRTPDWQVRLCLLLDVSESAQGWQSVIGTRIRQLLSALTYAVYNEERCYSVSFTYASLTGLPKSNCSSAPLLLEKEVSLCLLAYVKSLSLDTWLLDKQEDESRLTFTTPTFKELDRR